MNFINESCRKHDTEKIETEWAFFPIYTIMFVAAVILNSLLLHVVIKKEHFVHEKRSFHKLFQCLIIFDLLISILLLPQIVIKFVADDTMTSPYLDGFVAIRDFCISSQMIILVLIAIDRLLAFLMPLGNFWRLNNVMIITKLILIIIFVLYLIRYILLTVPLDCRQKKVIDKYGKNTIAISGGLFMILTLIIYGVLFGLLCQRQLTRQRQSMSSMKFFKANQKLEMPLPDDESSSNNNNPKTQIRDSTIGEKSRSKLNLARLTLRRRIGSIKFAKVLLFVNILMIASYLPAILYNGNITPFPSYSIYYLFYLHALGDPIIFFSTRPELKRGLISIFNPRS